MVGKDLIMATLFGSGVGSSGGGGTGGGSAGVQPKEVNFYDYDGTCVHAYTVAEAQKLSELPAGPEHPGLVFQGWNWSLEGVKGLTRAMNIGAMYTTDDGTTRLYITLQEGRTSPMLGIGVNGTVTVDWGDGTEPDVLTGTSTSTTKWTPNHAYAAPGDYVIQLTVDGEMGFTGSSSTNQYGSILRYTSFSDARNAVYQNALRKIEVGSGVAKIGDYSFKGSASLNAVIIPIGVTYIGMYAFEACHTLTNIVIPLGVDGIGNYVTQQCYALKNVSLNERLLNIGADCFFGCSSLVTVCLPDAIADIPSLFRGCKGLVRLIVPRDAEVIMNNAFYNCTGVAFYDFTACAAVPTLSATSAFTGIPADCEIRVPASLYDEWIAATNWATYADYIKAY